MSATNDRNSRKLCDWLAELGFEAHLCSDHGLLLEEIMPTPRDWALLILDSDSMGGPKATHAKLLHLRGASACFPVIVLGNRAETASLIEITANEPVPVLTKPFSQRSIVSAVNRAMAGR
ncbi:MAG: hypothetical protein ACQEVT_01140 [Pseudomonadota bacterium]